MIFRLELHTDDPEIIDVLVDVKNRAKFVKKALRHFISTKRGKETLMVMSRARADVGSGRIEPARTNASEKSITARITTGTGDLKKLKDRRKLDKSCPPPSGNIRDTYDFDRFL